MSTPATSPGSSMISGRRRGTDRIMRGLLLLAIIIALTPLIWILFDVVKMGFHALSGAFFTQGPPGNASVRGGGVLNGIIGTLIMVGLAALAAVPLGVLGAIWLVEFGGRAKRASFVRFFADVMTGIPSIVFGIFVYTLIVLATHHFSALAGSVALALIMWPVVLRTSEEMLRLVPNELREAAYALGTPTWRTVLKVVLPSAAGGLVTGIMLALARAAGETAPLLFTALNNQFVSLAVNKPMASLPTEIFRNAAQPYSVAVERAWASALTLILLVLVLSLGARAIVARRGGNQE
ncbi:MAG: phosphate ABC transporter permease PstA [Actinomycetota bacterium]